MDNNKILLFRVIYRNRSYNFTNANYDVQIPDITSNNTVIRTNDIFISINIKLNSAIIRDGGLDDNPVTINVDSISPFTLLTPFDKKMEIEIYELVTTNVGDDNYINMLFKGEVTNYSFDRQYTLRVSTPKVNFELSLPVLTTSTICPYVPYGELCRVNKLNHRKRIAIIAVKDRIIHFNINNYSGWKSRQSYLTSNNLGNNFTNGYLEDKNSSYTIEEHEIKKYTCATTSTTTLIITTTDTFYINQKVELLPSGSYTTIVSLTTTASTVSLTFTSSVIGINQICVNRFYIKDDIDLSGNLWAYEGDNRSLDHCKLKFNNESRFSGFLDIPDRNPVTSPIVR